MDRRWWGAAVVLAVLLVALIVQGVSGARLGGSPVRVPIEGMPSVGNCLQAAPTRGGGAFDSPRMRVFSGSVGACGEANFGEVISVQDAASFPGSTTDRQAVLDPLACRRPAARYAGWSLPEPATARPADQVQWQSTALQNLILFGPDAGQFFTGQRWLACVLLPRKAPYAGSLRDVGPGPAADAFGTCRATANETADPYVPCGEPHVSEVFGVGTVGAAQVPELLAACGQLVTEVTGLVDPTAGGALSVWVEAGGSFGDPAQDRDAGSSPGRCLVAATGGRQLDASLLGVGQGPLPLVP